MIAKLTGPLREAPATAPAIGALGLFVAWATDQAGYPVTHWAPGGIVLLALLAIAAAAVGVRARAVPRPVSVALVCLAGYTALSFLSILWAEVPGDAWEGANRTLLYLVVFALFACWPQRGKSAALLLGGWTLSLTGLGAFTLLHLDAMGTGGLATAFPGGRLIYPSGYANANAAQWLMAFWPALLLARRPPLPSVLRGLFAGGAVLLGGVALLSQSRGSLYATPVMLVLVFALLPGRARTFVTLAPVAAGLGAAAPFVVRVGDHLRNGGPTPHNMHTATAAVLVAAIAVAVVVAVAAEVEARRRVSPDTERRIHRTVVAIALAVLVAVLAGGWIAAGHPVSRVEHAWNTFKSPKGYGANSTGNRLVSGLGSNRYDFYRVSLDEFTANPLEGIGVDNFQQQYLARGHSHESPHYPHSVELRVLTETGLLGAVLAVIGLGAALLAALSACGVPLRRALRAESRQNDRDGDSQPDPRQRREDSLAPAVAAAALAAFGYWVVHGSFDWFWEFAGLGAPAFAMLGLACSLAPSAAGPRSPIARRARGRGRGAIAALAAAAVLALAAAASLAAPWLSQLQVQSAARVWTFAPQVAYSRLHEAADLNPLSDEPYLVAGSIALRYGELARADREFAAALARTPGDAYATLERAAIASAQGRQAAAVRLIERAHALQPREPVTTNVLRQIREGRRIDIEGLNRSILTKAQQLA